MYFLLSWFNKLYIYILRNRYVVLVGGCYLTFSVTSTGTENMDAIFHEKQEGSLCAQHCLNALLQGPYFTAIELADIAHQLDERERERMAEGGINSEGYQHFLQQPSHNYDDSGFFSVQVIDTALRVWGLELLPYNSQNPISREARADPTQMKSYICNFGEHWLTVRKLGNQWFNLNSLLSGPELISDTYLGMFLTQLQQDGYSIFIVTGELMECEADQVLKHIHAVQPVHPHLINNKAQSKANKEGTSEESNSEMQAALKESKEFNEADDVSLLRALELSMEGFIEESISRIDTACTTRETSQKDNTVSETANVGCVSGGTTALEQPAAVFKTNEIGQKQIAFLDKLDSTTYEIAVNTEESIENTTSPSDIHTIVTEDKNETDLNEEEMLEQAIAMSMVQEL